MSELHSFTLGARAVVYLYAFLCATLLLDGFLGRVAANVLRFYSREPPGKRAYELNDSGTRFFGEFIKLLVTTCGYGFAVAAQFATGLAARSRTTALCAVGLCAGAFLLYHNDLVVATVDELYNSTFPLRLALKHFANYVRVVYSTFVGLWNAVSVWIRLAPRVLAKAGATCDVVGPGALLVGVVRKIGEGMYEFGNALAAWTYGNFEPDLDVRTALAAARAALAEILTLSRCFCDDYLVQRGLRAATHPLYTARTDDALGAAFALVARVAVAPYAAVYQAADLRLYSLDPIFDLLTRERGLGAFSAAADVCNEWGGEALAWLQTEMDESVPRLEFPPIFSVLHRLTSAAAETARVASRAFIKVPRYVELLAQEKFTEGRQVFHRAATARAVARELELASHAAFVRCLMPFDRFLWKPDGRGVEFTLGDFGSLAHGLVSASLEFGFIAYNATATFLVGAYSLPKVSRRGCELELLSDVEAPVFARFWNSLSLALDAFSKDFVPKAVDSCRLGGGFLAGFYAPVGESATQLCMAVWREVEAFAWAATYAISRQMKGAVIASSCVEGFYEEAHEHERSFLAVLPSLVTALLDLPDVQESGFVTLSCAESTHRNHVYSGSLKMFIFSNEACEASRTLFGHPERRGAYSDFNVNSVCAGSDALMAVAETFISQNRYMVEQVAGLLEVVSSCIADPAADACVRAPIANQLELLKLGLNALTCMLGEFLYRLAEVGVSVLSPAIALTYGAYPDDGYVVSAGGGYHVQAKPIEAALITWLTSFFGLVHYAYRFTTQVNRKMLEVATDSLESAKDGKTSEALGKIFIAMVSYRFEVMAMGVRSVILYAGDVFIGTMQLARAVATVDRWISAPAASKPDPNVPHKSFTDFQEAIVDLIGLIESFAQLLEEAFWRGLEAAFQALFLLIRGLLSGDASQILKFFEFVFKELERFLKFIAEGVWMLISDPEGGLGKIVALVCDAINLVKDGVCVVMTTKWLPVGFKILCGSKKEKCWWLPSSIIGMKTPGSDIEAATAVAEENIAGAGAVDIELSYARVEGKFHVFPAAGKANYELLPYSYDCTLYECTNYFQRTNLMFKDALNKYNGFNVLNMRFDEPCTNDTRCEGVITVEQKETTAAGDFWFTGGRHLEKLRFPFKQVGLGDNKEYYVPDVGSEQRDTFWLDFNYRELDFKIDSQATWRSTVMAVQRFKFLVGECADEGETEEYAREYWYHVFSDEYQPPWEDKTKSWEGLDAFYSSNGACSYPLIRFRAVYNEKIYYSNTIDVRYLTNFNKDGVIKYFKNTHAETSVLPPQPPPPPAPAPARRRLQGSGIPNPIEEIEKIANKAADLVDDIKDAVEDVIDKIVTIYPSKFEFQFAALATKDGAKGLIKGLNGDKICADITCTRGIGDKNLTYARPTVCSKEEDCTPNAFCWTPFQDDCPAFTPKDINWANACECKGLSIGAYHCNFATGFCQAGPSPFVDALEVCPGSGSLLQNRLCRVSEAWKCAGLGHTEEIECRVEKARGAPARLCRAFCDDLPHMDGNSLTSFADQCVCEVGADRLTARNITIALKVGSERRKLLAFEELSNASSPAGGSFANETESQNASHWYVHFGRGLDEATGLTRCASALDCASSSVTSLRVCRSLWGTPVPCYSCSERTHSTWWGDAEGFGCDAETRLCACSAPPATSEFTDELVDLFDWRGNSWCDRVMRGYHTHAVKAPIERASILRCTMLRAAGAAVGQAIGLPTLPNDIFYNPARILWVGKDLFEGLMTYVLEGFDDRPVEEFFEDLVKRRVDPILVFKVLETAQRLVRRGAEAIQQANITGAIEQAASGLSPKAADYLHETFTVAREVIAKTHFSTEAYARFRWSAAVAAAPVARFAYHTARDVVARRRLQRASPGAADGSGRAEFSNRTSRAREGPAWRGFDNARALVASAGSTFGRALKVASDAAGDCVFAELVKDTALDGAKQLVSHYAPNGTFGRTLCEFEKFERRRYKVTNLDVLLGELERLSDDETCEPRQNTSNLPRFEFPNPAPEPVRLPPQVSYFFGKSITKKVENLLGGATALATSSEIPTAAKALLDDLAKCDWESLACRKNKSTSLMRGGAYAELFALGSATAFSWLGAPTALVATYAVAAQLAVPAATLYAVYGHSPLCLPALPVCLADDLFDALDRAMPAMIHWPAEIVPDQRERVSFGFLKLIAPRNCRESGYVSGWDAFAWAFAHFDVSPPAWLLDSLPEFRSAYRRRLEFVDSGWCAALGSGVWAISVSASALLLVSSISLPLILFSFNVLASTDRLFDASGELLHALRGPGETS